MSKEIPPSQNISHNSHSPKGFNLSDFVARLPLECKVAYLDIDEISNYHNPGSYFEGLNNKEVLERITKKALEIGLPQENVVEFLRNSDIFLHLTEKQRARLLKDFWPRDSLKKNKEHGDKPNILYKTRFTYDGWHYCEFSDNGALCFLKYRDGQSEIVLSVKIPDPDAEDSEITILPAPQIAQTKRDRVLQEDRNEAVKFPPGPIDYESEYALYCEIKAFIHAFMELKPEDEIILALYVMKAAIFDALKDTSFPFIHILAPYGKGKSRLLTVVCEITPFGFYSVDIKSAALKRISDLYSAPLFVDEKGQMDSELAAILNGKYNANALVLNANNDIQQGYSAIIGYRIFGPLVLAGRTPFRDDAIESKSFQINMDFELTRDDVPRKIKGDLLDSFTERARDIRGKLLQFRVKWHDRINGIKKSDFLKPYEKHTEPRLFEVISFFEDLLEIIPEIKAEIGEVLKSQILRNAQVAAETPNGIIANEVLTLMGSPEATEEYSIGGRSYTGIYLSAIYDEIGKDYSKQTGKILSALGLKTDRPRITKTKKGNDGKPQEYTKRYSMVRIPDEKKINELKSRYDPDFVVDKLSSIEKGQQTILDDEDDEDDEKGRGTHNFNGKGDNGPEFSKPSEQKKSSDSKDNLQSSKTFRVNKDIEKENYSENNTNKNNKATLEINAHESKEDKKTDTPPKNDSPHSPLSPDLKGEPLNSDVQNENSLWRINPKKALFDLVEIEAPRARYHSLLPKAIFDMIPDPEMTVKRVYDLCEQLTDEGAFLKNKAGAYSVNTEFLNGGGYQ